jgi:putative DNA primase/helicase
VLAGVISTPTMRPDGSLLTKLGYDEETRLLLIEPPEMPDIPDAPTRDDALKAVQQIEDLLTEFPFIDETAKAVALAAIITPIVRGAFLVSPMFLFNAPVAGSGKSFFCDTVSVIAIGQLMPVMAAGRNEEETEKRLGAALIAGQPLINIDNISGDLYGDALCQFIERPIVDVRVLGKSESKRIEARGTTIYGNGNNVVVRGDLCRRVLMATLDPRVERPELRPFKGNPVATVLADRGPYIAACLTICKAYIAAGRPNLAPKLGSFEGWSDTVRSALIWLGKADPVASMELSRAEDPERLDLCNFMTAWAAAFGGVGYSRRRTLATVIATEGFPDLQAAVAAATFSVTGRRGQEPDAAALGQYLRRHKNRVIDGKRFVTNANPKGGSAWWIEDVKPQTQTHEDQADQVTGSTTGPDDENDPPQARSVAPRF